MQLEIRSEFDDCVGNNHVQKRADQGQKSHREGKQRTAVSKTGATVDQESSLKYQLGKKA